MSPDQANAKSFRRATLCYQTIHQGALALQLVIFVLITKGELYFCFQVSYTVDLKAWIKRCLFHC